MNKLAIGLGFAVLLIVALLMFQLGRTAADRSATEPVAVDAGPSQNTPAATVPGQPEPTRGDEIPAMFQGSWAPDRLSCSARGETARVDIGATQMEYYESTGRVGRVSAQSGGREYALELSVAGEGQNWTRNITLRRVGHEMALRDGEGEEQLYIRC